MSKDTLPLTQFLDITGRALPPHLTSLQAALEALITTSCPAPPSRDDLAFPHVAEREPMPVRVLLKILGYLKTSPCLQCVLLHHCVETLTSGVGIDIGLEVLDRLHADVCNIVAKWDAECRHILLRPLIVYRQPSPCPGGGDLATRLLRLCRLRRDVAVSVPATLHTLKKEVPRPCLIIAPSSIAVAHLGVHIVGRVSEGTPVAPYCGAFVPHDVARNTGYSLQHGTQRIDASVDRCVASMTNDPRDASGTFEANCIFSRFNHAPALRCTRILCDEELFVRYGSSFKLEDTSSACIMARVRDPMVGMQRRPQNQFPLSCYDK